MRPAVLIPGLIVIYIGLAALVLLALPGRRGPLNYLVAGAFAAGVCLVIGFWFGAKSIRSRTARKSGRSS